MYFATIYGNNPSLVKCLVRHESGFDPTAQNPNSSAGGLFQFIDSTWEETQDRAGVYGDKYDPRVNAELGNWLLANDGPKHWEVYTNNTCRK